MTRRDRGFTLVEVMVALTIVAVALGAGLRAAGSLTDSALRLTEMSQAQWCADNQLTELRLQRQFPDIGTADFQCLQMGRIFQGRIVAQPTPNPNFRRVDAEILDERGERMLRLRTVMGRP